MHRFLAFLTILAATASLSLAQDASQLPAPAAAKETILHKFCSRDNCADGSQPQAPLIMDKQGNLYGTTEFGGATGNGAVFELQHTSTGWKETVLYSFCPVVTNCSDGQEPVAGLAFDAKGDLYGTTTYGGSVCPLNQSETCGVVFELTKSKGVWTETVLHAFGSDANTYDGFFPAGGVTFDASGNIYGATSQGGDSTTCLETGCGVLYKLTPSEGGWEETILHYFALEGTPDGIYPSSGVTFDSSGNFYGTTSSCLSSCQGAVYKFNPTGPTETMLYQFSGGKDGGYPWGGVVLEGSGNLYGTTAFGGNGTYPSGGDGVVFKVGPKGKETVLHTFTGNPDGRKPFAPLTLDSSGNLYGTTSEGGSCTVYINGCGILFELKTTGGKEEMRFSFSGTNGENPQAGLLLSGGVLYGTAELSSQSGVEGLVFSFAP
jgi:uncharacterized repeat protein (TIGR03803 family)